MPAPVPLAKIDLVYSRGDDRRHGVDSARRRSLWGAAVIVAAVIGLGIPAFFAWKHPITASGGRYFLHRVEIPVPAPGAERSALDVQAPRPDV